MTEDIGAPASGTGSHADARSPDGLGPSGFHPSRVTQRDRQWCTRFDRSAGFLEGKWDHSTITMKPVVEHRLEVQADIARRIFDEVHGDPAIPTGSAIAVYAAIKRALRDTDGSRNGGDACGSVRSTTAGAEGIAQDDAA